MATAKKQRIEFRSLNVGNMTTYIDNATAGKFNHVFELTATHISCRAFPQDKKFIKYTGAELKDILQFVKLPENFESVKVPIYQMDKLKTALSVISDASIDDASGYIEYEVDEKNGGLVATSINFKSKKVANKVKATDQVMFTYLPKDKFDEFCDTTGYCMKFNVDRDLRAKVLNIFALDGENTFSLKYDKDTKEVTMFSGELWSFLLDDVEIVSEESFAFDIPKDAFSRMVLPLYTVYLTIQANGKMRMKSYSDEYNVLMNDVVLYDPNRVSVAKK